MRRPQIKIPEVEYYQKVSSDAQILPQGAENQQSKVNVGGGCTGQRPILLFIRYSLELARARQLKKCVGCHLLFYLHCAGI